MKQIEKLDLLLKALYEKPEKRGEIVDLLKTIGINITLDEAHRLGEKLEKDGYVDYSPTKDSAYVDLNGDGVEYVEGDSYTHMGHSVITNTYNNTIVNSPNANLVNQSANINITQNGVTIQQTIERIKQELGNDKSMTLDKKQEVTECLQEVEDGIASGKAPKYAFKALTDLASNIASVGSLVIQLGQLMGLIPPLA